MKHLTPANAKAAQFSEAAAEGREDEVVAMNSLVGCTTSFARMASASSTAMRSPRNTAHACTSPTR